MRAEERERVVQTAAAAIAESKIRASSRTIRRMSHREAGSWSIILAWSASGRATMGWVEL